MVYDNGKQFGTVSDFEESIMYNWSRVTDFSIQ